MPRRPLGPEEIQARLATVPHWTLDRDQLTRSFQFVDFVTAFAFMAQAALHAERRDHHPQWTNVYGRVDVVLTTHDAGGLTALDFELAAILSRLAEPLPQKAS
jgi:4a-hydroxytetrahydrobiopterin dehydratase